MRCLVILTGCMFLAVTACKAPQPASTPQPESAAPEPAAPEPPALRVGAASGTVNPSEGVFLGGYGYGRRCTGVHDNLYAKAVVFDDGKTPLALVVVDALSLQYATVQAIREAASKRTGDLTIPPERIIAQATHSHCAPDTIGIYGADPATSGVDPAYLEQLAIVTAIQVERAVAALRPARLVWAEAECVGWAVNDSEPDVLDNSVTVIQCLDGSGANIATLTNFACHPTVLDEDTTLAGADWVGAFYKAMARALPGEHLFLQGAIGAWIQPLTPERTFELADRYGRDLAEKTLAALRTSRSLEGTAIRFARKVFDMPLHNELLRQMIETKLVAREMSDGAVRTEVAWFAVGDAQFATHPGETAPMFAAETRELMDSGPKCVLGLALDHGGYICPPHYFDDPEAIPHAPYLTSMSPGRDAGPVMMAALKEIIP